MVKPSYWGVHMTSIALTTSEGYTSENAVPSTQRANELNDKGEAYTM